ncbi:MAG: hypothetical protein ACOYT8_03420 [Candidatus Dependentiae bacterium]
MNKFLAVLTLIFTTYLSTFGYTKKIEYLKNPKTNAEVHIFYDFHADEKFPGQVKQQVQEIIEAAQQKNAHIIIENTFDYHGKHTLVKQDLAFFKYMRKALLLRDVQDLAHKNKISIENVEYRQDREYSVNENRLSAHDALDPVSEALKAVKNFKGDVLREYYQEVINDIEPIHQEIIKLFKPNQSIFKQLPNKNIQTKLGEIKKELPTDCADMQNGDVVLYYDARLLNPLIVDSIYEKQVANDKHSCIFVIAGSYHAFEISNVLQMQLNYQLVKEGGTDQGAFIPAASKIELAQIKQFFNDNLTSNAPVAVPDIKQHLSHLFAPSYLII